MAIGPEMDSATTLSAVPMGTVINMPHIQVGAMARTGSRLHCHVRVSTLFVRRCINSCVLF